MIRLCRLKKWAPRKRVCQRQRLCCCFCDLRETCGSPVKCENDASRCGCAEDDETTLLEWEMNQYKLGTLEPVTVGETAFYGKGVEAEEAEYRVIQSRATGCFRAARHIPGGVGWKMAPYFPWQRTYEEAKHRLARHAARHGLRRAP